MVSVDKDPFLVKPFVDKKGFTAEVALTDGFIQSAYGVSGIPHTVAIDKKGTVRFQEIGFGPGSEDILRALMDNLLAEKDAPAATAGK